MRLTVLASGSSGNAYLIESGPTALLVDAGLSGRELARRLRAAGCAREPIGLNGVVLTHEHRDHVLGVQLLIDLGVPVWATPGTIRAGRLGMWPRPLRVGEVQTIGALQVRPVRSTHDAAEPVGYVIEDDTSRLGLLTDCGCTSPELTRAYRGCQALVLEFNHDPQLLAGGPYPAALKRRIASRLGHLANQQAGELLATLELAELSTLVLAHLSETNNSPQLALAAAWSALGAHAEHVAVHVGRQDEPLPSLQLAARRPTQPPAPLRPAPPGRASSAQLTLPGILWGASAGATDESP